MSLIDVKKKLLMAQKGGLDVSDVFNTSLWTGTGAARTITTGIDSGEGSLVWIKQRNAIRNNILNDSIRGPNSFVSSNTTSAVSTTAGLITGFDSTGYQIGSSSGVNGLGDTYIGWQFRRAENFFDIVQYTGNGVAGRQIAHNLGVKQGMMIVKRIDAAGDWQVYNQAQGAAKYGVLNSTATFATATNRWNNTEPTASVFTVGNDVTINANGGTYIAYLFAHDPSPEGLIQCGSYVGNGLSPGPTVNLGWRPQYLMIKAATTVGDWILIDAARGIFPSGRYLSADSSAAEAAADWVNQTASGFQVRQSASLVNGNGQTYIYMAIREAI